MTEALALVQVTADQVDLIRRTVAQNATNDELQLYFYDCQRRNVHPLDKLIHFTKRNGKYTPITSIDFMRSQASDSGDYAGNDDAVFESIDGALFPEKASVTVWRLIQGQRCPFTATARWAEYYPGDELGFMWRKMPHTMLGKCAEALALRKAFPRQLAGLYAAEEMDQGGKKSKAPIDSGELVEPEEARDAVEISGTIVTEKQNARGFWYQIEDAGAKPKKLRVIFSPVETDSGRLAERIGYFVTVKGVPIESAGGKEAYALTEVVALTKPPESAQDGKQPPQLQPKHETAPQSQPAASKGVITKPQNIELQKARKQSGIPDEDYYAVLHAIAGVEHGPDIQKEHYKAIYDEIANWRPTENQDAEPAELFNQ